MGNDLERPDCSDWNFSKETKKFEEEESKRLNIIDTIIFADFDKKVLVGECKAKDFKHSSVRTGGDTTI